VRDAPVELAGERPTSGDRRLRVLLQRPGHAVKARRVRRRRPERGSAGAAPRRVPRTTDRDHASPRFADLVEGLEVERPDQVWVADLTSVRLQEGFIDLAVIREVFTRAMRGRPLGRGLEQELTLTAPGRAREQSRPEVDPSDRGVESAAPASVGMLEAAGAALRMARVGVPEAEGSAARLMRMIKEEEVA
jgi:putative transposase